MHEYEHKAEQKTPNGSRKR